VVSVTPVTSEQVQWLETLREEDTQDRIDFWDSPHVNQDLYMRIAPEAEDEVMHLMDVMHLHHEVKLQNLQALVDLEAASLPSPSSSALGKYVRSNQIYTFMEQLAHSHKKIMSLTNIGKSYEGKPLMVAKFSTGAGRPAIFVNSGMHSREWIAHASMVWIMNELATKYGSDSKITSFLDKFDVYLMPLVNPDGYDYSHDKERFWRKTRSRTSSGRCMGADPNRNWDANFGGEGTSSNPCSDIFHGVRAFSEAETAALSRFLTSIKGDLKMYIDVHSYSQFWMTPHGHTRARPSDAKEMDRVAHIGADAIRAVNGNKFTVGTPPQLLYVAAGGAFDWAKVKLGVKYTYALELRPSGGGIFGFVVPAAEIPDSGRETLAGLMAAAQAMNI